jgi:colicin import membrane protein
MNSGEQPYSHRERWLAVLSSVLLHAAVVVLLGWGWWQFRAARPGPRQLAIEATVVMEKSATVAPAIASSVAIPPAVPAADAAATREREQAERLQQEQRSEHEREAQRRAEEQARREREQREQVEAAAKQQAQEAAARKSKEAARLAARDKARREAELRAQLAAEERINAARGSAEEAAWLALVRDRVTRAWIRPPSARAGVNCEVYVTQVPGGVVTGVKIGSCNGDAAVRESIEAAVYRASPLPTPSNPDLFDRNLKFNFHPDE